MNRAGRRVVRRAPCTLWHGEECGGQLTNTVTKTKKLPLPARPETLLIAEAVWEVVRGKVSDHFLVNPEAKNAQCVLSQLKPSGEDPSRKSCLSCLRPSRQRDGRVVLPPLNEESERTSTVSILRKGKGRLRCKTV